MSMTKEQFLKLNHDDVLIVDIREDGEVTVKPSPEGAAHIPMQIFADYVEDGTIPKDKKVITVCHSGGRCMMLHQHLLDHGYDADYLEGGVMGL